MSKNTRVKKAMATATNNELLYTIAENAEAMKTSAIYEAVAINNWKTAFHYDAVITAGRAKDADEDAVKKAENAKQALHTFINSSNNPFHGEYKEASKKVNSAVRALAGKKDSARARLVSACYEAYVENVKISGKGVGLDNALRALILTKGGLDIRTDAKTASDIATRLVYAFGVTSANKAGFQSGRSVGAVQVMTEAQFKGVLFRALASMAMTGNIDLSAC